jgi:hypothetical protein
LSQLLRQVSGVLLAKARLLLQPGKLLEQQGALKFGHSDVGPAPCVRKPGGSLSSTSVGMEREATVYQLAAVAKDRSAFAAAKILRNLEAETAGVSPSPHLLAPPLSQVGLAGIFNDRYLVLFGNGEDAVQVGRVTTEVNRNDTPRPIRDGIFYLFCVDLKGCGIRVHENRQGVLQKDHVNGSHKSVGWHDHLIPRSNPECIE